MIPITFRQKRLPFRSDEDCSRLLNCLYRKQSVKYNVNCRNIDILLVLFHNRCHTAYGKTKAVLDQNIALSANIVKY